MGQLIEGVWHPGWYEPNARGAFERPRTLFRERVVSRREAPAGARFVAEPGRYHIYASYACPWAHRALLTRSLRGLEDVVGLTIVDPKMGPDGWSFGGERGEADPLFGATYLREIYLRVNPKLSGRVTVPVLWDKESGTIVNNESREVMRILDTAFDEFAQDPTTLAPADLVPAIDRALDEIYPTYNNGVYRAGFARSQHAYDEACRQVFATLERCEERLGAQRYMCGDRLTEADLAMFTTSLRFDLVYYAHFKCNLHRLADLPNVWGFLRDLYQRPAIRRTCHLDHIKTHYYWSQDTVNPTRIVPLGPTLDLDAPHDRARFGGAS